MKRFFPFFSFSLLILLAACESGGPDDNGDHELPVIQVIYPNQNAAWHIGDTVSIQANITDNDELNQLYVSVTGPDSELYYEITNDLTGDSVYHLNQSWIVSGVSNPPADGLVEVSVSDKNFNIQSVFRTVNLIE